MTEYWLAAAIGAGIGLAMLALFARGSAKFLANNGYLALIAMLSIYIGARLVSGTFTEVIYETVFASIVAIGTRLWMDRWLPAIGIVIFGHGCYDAFLGAHTGVAEWYPPLCAGFDFVVGVGLLIILIRRKNDTVLTQ